MEDITTLSHFPSANHTQQSSGSKTQAGWIPLGHVPMKAVLEVKSMSTDESHVLFHTNPTNAPLQLLSVTPTPGAQATHTHHGWQWEIHTDLRARNEMTLPRKASAFSNQEEQPVQPPQPAPARLSPFWEGKVAKGEPAAGLTQTGGFTGRVIPSSEDPAASGSPERSVMVSISGQRGTRTDF